ncbi:MAG: hypothetical protein HZR80_12640 [Candidatus Heimdallarchaeota archaeon]
MSSIAKKKFVEVEQLLIHGNFKEAKANTKIIWYYGHWPKSFSSLYLRIRGKKLTLVMLANSDGLSHGFNLGNGDFMTSPFFIAFLEIIVTKNKVS